MATKNIVPRADAEGQLGTSTKGWGKIFLGGAAANIDVNNVSGTNTAGKSLTLISGASTGSGAGGSIVFQTAAAGGSGTSVNSHATVLTLDSAKLATFTGGLDIAGAVDIAGDLTLSAGADGALNFSAASSIKILDNSATSLVIEEADTAYMTFVTTNSSEAIKFDKALDINAAVQLDSTLTVGVNDTGYDVKFFGATSGKSLLWDESADSLIVTGTTDLIGTTNLDIVDIDGAVNMATTALVTGVLTTTATQVANGGITSGSNIVSDTDSTDDLGTTSVRWANLFVDGITATDQITATGFTGTLDGILGSGTPAAATVTTLNTSGNITAAAAAVRVTVQDNADSASGGTLAIQNTDTGVNNHEGGRLYFYADDSSNNVIEAGLITSIFTNVSPTAKASSLRLSTYGSNGQVHTLTLAGTGIQVIDSGTIGCASDTNLLTLADQSLTIGGKISVNTGNAVLSNFGSTSVGTTNTNYTGISLGYSETASYTKTAIVQEQIGDGAARGHLHFLVDTSNDGNNVTLGDSKMNIHGTTGDVSITGGNLAVKTDDKGFVFGANGDVSLTHEHNKGLIFKNNVNDAALLTFQTSKTAIADENAIGLIQFQAPNEADGSDAITVGAEIRVRAAQAFGADAGAMEMFFGTKASGNNEVVTTRMELGSSGDLKLNTGSLIIGTPGEGIDFASTNVPAQAAGSGTSNLLDDYEEGTWTPSFGFSTNSVAYDTTNTGGLYTKVGRKVTVIGALLINGTSSPAGITTIQGLPFTVTNSGEKSVAGITIGIIRNLSIDNPNIKGYPTINSTQVVLTINSSDAAFSAFQANTFTSSSQLYFTATYFTAT